MGGEVLGVSSWSATLLAAAEAMPSSTGSPLDRVVQMQVPRRVGVADGASKYRAIRAALRGAWANVLVTDLDTARALAEDESSS
jgi:DNA-binding transcriptional regulator LsrR (DeoR family)